MSKPSVFFCIKLTSKHFILSSFTANLSHLKPPMDYHDDLVASVKEEFVTPGMEIRARIHANGPARAILLGWSSEFPDAPDTRVDERWVEIASKTLTDAAGIIELTGTFEPYRSRS